MSDWRPGDLAECIKRDPWIDSDSFLAKTDGPKFGDVIEVVHVVRNLQEGGVFLFFGQWFFDAWAAVHFRKVVRKAAGNKADARRKVPA